MNPEKAVSNELESRAVANDVDATLRLVASLPAPDGLEDRVHEALRAVPRTARVLEWPSMFRTDSGWMRSAAAAAIAFVVVGGGWGVYSRVQTAKVIAMPSQVSGQGGFSGAGAKRTPQTLNGPVISVPSVNQAAQGGSSVNAAAPRVVKMPARQGAAADAADRIATPPAK